MMDWWKLGRLVAGACVVSLFGESFAQTSESLDESMSSAAEAALARVAQDVEQRGVNSRPQVQGVTVRRKSTLGTSDPIYRLGVAYYDEWTIRAGALKLRVPAYQGWGGVKPSSEFYEQQAFNGVPGEHLALAITNAQFIRSTRSKYVNDFGLIWVPQEHAFVSMSEVGFEEFKDGLQRQIVEGRRSGLDREDFIRYEDYVAFKKGDDAEIDEYMDGYLLLAMEEPDLVMYFATSEFIYQTSREEIRQPMIMTVTYALVRGKLLRFDFKRLFLDDEDAVRLISFSRRFVDDMRTVNGLSDRKIR